MIDAGIYSVSSIDSMDWPYDEIGQPCWCGCGRTRLVREVRDGFLATNVVGRRLWQRIDRFSAIALGLTDSLARRAKESAPPEEIGVFVGNEIGGWTYAAPQLANLKNRGWRHVGTFLATAWFPAAAQGEISIRYGLKGLSKTFSTIGLSGLEAVYFGALAISVGRLRFAIAGAVEAPTSDFALRGMFGCPQPTFQPVSDSGAFLLLGSARPGVPRLSIGPVVVGSERQRSSVSEVGGARQVCRLLQRLHELPVGGCHRESARSNGRTVTYILEK